jgi:hypothetical protein
MSIVKKYRVLTSAQQAEMMIGITAAVIDQIVTQFPEEQKSKRIYRQISDLNQRLHGILAHLEESDKLNEALAIATDVVDEFTQALLRLGLVEEEVEVEP